MQEGLYNTMKSRIVPMEEFRVITGFSFSNSGAKRTHSRTNVAGSRVIFAGIVLVLTIFPPARMAAGESVEEKRSRIRSMATDTLQSLYKFQPGSQAVVERAAGYAVFDNTGVHVVLPTTAKRMGVAVDSSGKETFMKMRSEPGRAASAVDDCRMVFVFETRKALDRFLDSGWTGSDWHDTPVETKGGEYEGAFRVDRDMWVYQIVERGLAFQLILAGTNYYKEDKLNKR
jgi:hypothetical protein